MTVKCLDRLGVALHAPMVDGGIRHQTDSVHIDPLPEGDFLRHRVGLHLALHLNVEDLEGAAS